MTQCGKPLIARIGRSLSSTHFKTLVSRNPAGAELWAMAMGSAAMSGMMSSAVTIDRQREGGVRCGSRRRSIHTYWIVLSSEQIDCHVAHLERETDSCFGQG